MSVTQNGIRIKLGTLVIGILMGAAPTAAFGVFVNYWIELPALRKTDDQMQADLKRLEGRFANMVTRFDKLDAEEHTESAHNAELTTEEKVSTALVTELAGHIHAQDGRLDSHETRMQQLQQELTRLRSDLDGLIAASGRRR